MNALSGIIHTSNYPNNYAFNAECIWNIAVPNGYHVQLEFIDIFDLEVNNDCAKDFVEASTTVLFPIFT